MILGIDPGKSGALCWMSESGIADLSPMPISWKSYDMSLLRTFIASSQVVIIERQQPLPPKMGGSLASYWRGASQYLLEGLCVGLQIPYEIVRPVDWQKEFFQGLSKDLGKQRSVIVCKRLFPEVDLRRTPRCHKDDDGIADAILIAEYGRRRRNRS